MPAHRRQIDWPKDLTIWDETANGKIVRRCMSVPFTWLLPKAKRYIEAFPGVWLVGGPAVALMPDYLAKVAQIGYQYPGVLQRVNPLATRTTEGCPRRCKFCGVNKIEPVYRELASWPKLPIVCDNNLTAASRNHFRKVINGLRNLDWCDFNQGLDCRLLTPWHARLLAGLKGAIVRLALDNDSEQVYWAGAVDILRTAGVPKSRIRSYVLCGFDGSEESDWRRCNFVESFGVMALPMWYHRLDAMRFGEITPVQEAKGWTKEKQRRLMRHFYKHQKA